MKLLFIVIGILFSEMSFAQDVNHNIFGLDMDLDFYSLTNYQQYGYFIADTEFPDDPYVITDFDFHLSKVDIQLEKLGFSVHLLGFNKGEQTRLESLSPTMYIGRIEYSSEYAFNSQAFRDASNLAALLVNEYGDPILSMEETNFRVYKWESGDCTITVNSVREELTTNLTYLIRSR